MIIFIFRDWLIVILVAVHITSEPLAGQCCGFIQVPYLLWSAEDLGVWVRWLVIFMTMPSLAGFWEEKRLESITSSLTCVEYIISSLTCIVYIISSLTCIEYSI